MPTCTGPPPTRSGNLVGKIAGLAIGGDKQLNQRICSTAEALIHYGALVVKDSRVSEEDNAAFLDLLEDYFAQDNETLLKDTRPEYGYQGHPSAPATCGWLILRYRSRRDPSRN